MIKYQEFLRIISDGEFQTYRMDNFAELINTPLDSQDIAIGCRRDVDHDLGLARKMAVLEAEAGIHSTYFILHTAPYYKDKKNLLNSCKVIQSLGHEIGFHSNIVSAQVFDGLKIPVQWLMGELQWFEDNGIKITGVSQHGDRRCREYFYINEAFWMDMPIPDHFTFTREINGKQIVQAKEEWFKFEYNCSRLICSEYRSDCQYRNVYKDKWFEKFTDFGNTKEGDKIQVLIHPKYYA